MKTLRVSRPVTFPGCILLSARALAPLLFAAGLAATVVAADAPPVAPADGGASTSLTALAELPYWPIGFVPKVLDAPKPDREGRIRASVMAWVPPGARHLRALLIIPNNSDSKDFGQHGKLREAAARREMAIVYLRNGDIPQVQGILDELAEGTGIAEFRHAPWIPFGKSSRGKFPILMAWQHPERTIASISYHAETPTWPPDDVAKVAGETILHVNANGETEWGGTWFVHVRPSLLNYRVQSKWLPHIAVAKGVDHGDYPDASGSEGWGKAFPGRVTCIMMWDYLSVYVDKAIGLRVPTDCYASSGPVELKDVDESTGYLIGAFAVEDLYHQPHYPLVESNGVYVAGNADESPTSGFVAIAPAADYKTAEGVPVVAPELGKSPSAWLVTEGLRFAMQKDPLTDLGGMESLRPAPGNTVRIDDAEATFRPLAPQGVAPKGGISLQGLKKWGQALTLVGYTVLDVPAPMRAKLQAPFSVAGRLRVVINGVPVDHKQVVEFQKGLYPMLVVLRLSGPNWGAIDPHFLEVSESEVEQARKQAAEKARRKAEEADILAHGAKNAVPPVRRYADVPEADRRKMFWVADREQAEAWFKLIAVHGQTFDAP